MLSKAAWATPLWALIDPQRILRAGRELPVLPQYVLAGIASAGLTVLQFPLYRNLLAGQISSGGSVDPILLDKASSFQEWLMVIAFLGAPFLYGLLWTITLKYLMLLTDRQLSFRSLYAIAGYAYLPRVLGLALISFLAFGNPERVPVTSAAVFLPNEWVNRAVYRLVNWFDPFSVWGIVLLIMGLQTLTGMRVRPLALLVLAPWLAAASLFAAL